MVQKAGSKVGEAFVELGLDKNPFINSMKSLGVTFQSGLVTMGRQATDFSKTIGKTLGFALPAGAAAGLGAGLIELFKTEDPRLLFASLQADAPGGAAGAIKTLEGFQDALQKVDPTLTRRKLFEAANEFAILGDNAEKAGKQLQRAATLAGFVGLPIQAGAELLSKARREGVTAAELERFAIIQPAAADPKTLVEALNRAADDPKRRAAVEARAKLPGKRLEGLKTEFVDFLSSVGEFAVEGLFAAIDSFKEPEDKKGIFPPFTTIDPLKLPETAKGDAKKQRAFLETLSKVVKEEVEFVARGVGSQDVIDRLAKGSERFKHPEFRKKGVGKSLRDFFSTEDQAALVGESFREAEESQGIPGFDARALRGGIRTPEDLIRTNEEVARDRATRELIEATQDNTNATRGRVSEEDLTTANGMAVQF